MAEVIIKRKEQIDVLKATIGDKTYSIPLASSLPYVKLKVMRTDDKVIEFFKEYIPEEVFNSLVTDEVMQLVKAWNDATEAEQGASVGES
jgi:hypothetical protein